MRSRAPQDETPVGYRHAKWNYHVLSQWIDPGETERHVEWTRGVDRALSDYAEEALYVNFVGDPSTSAIRAAFGPENYARARGRQGRVRPGERVPQQHEHRAERRGGTRLGAPGGRRGASSAPPKQKSRPRASSVSIVAR